MASFPFEIEADHLKLSNNDQELYASGNVLIMYKNYTINAQSASYNKGENSLILNKHIEISSPDNHRLLADIVSLNLTNNVGFIVNGKLITNQDWVLSAKSIKLTEESIEFSNCSITKCSSSTPEWYISSDFISINQKNRQFESRSNTLYFYGIPIFYVPKYFDNQGKTTEGSPTPEFGYTQIDYLYGVIYYGYAIGENVTGKLGIGVSQKRGFRFGNTTIFPIGQQQLMTLKTYHVAQTGFEGGVQYRWDAKAHSNDSIIRGLVATDVKSKTHVSFMADYLVGEYFKAQRYNAIPEFKLSINNPKTLFNSEFSTLLSYGYFSDDYSEDQRQQVLVNLISPVIKFDQTLAMSNEFNIRASNYVTNNTKWHQLHNTILFDVSLFKVNNRISYTKLFYQTGKSPFIFDSINAIKDDEIGGNFTMGRRPLMLNIDTNYQLNLEAFRNLTLSTHWVMQCWEFNVGVDFIWDEVRFGFSIPNM